MKKRILCSVLALAMVMGLAACAAKPSSTTTATTTKSAETTTQSGSAGTTTEAPTTTSAEPVVKTYLAYSTNCLTLNPHLANSTEDAYNAWCQGRLYRNYYPEGAEKLTLAPDLAAAMPEQADADGKVWNIKIREDACWSDGTPITAETFVYSWKMALDPVMKNRAGENLMTQITIVNAKEYYQAKEGVTWDSVGIKALDKQTIQLTLSIASTQTAVAKQFVTYSACAVDPDLYEAGMSADRASTTYGTSVELTKYCGAFYPTTWVKDSKLVLEKNEKYVNADLVNFTNVELIYVANAQTGIEMYEKGQLSVVTLNAEVAVQYQDSPDYFTSAARYLTMIEINDASVYYVAGEKAGEITKVEVDPSTLDKPILTNMNFKNALWYSVDRVTLAKRESGYAANFIIPLTSMMGEDSQVKFRDTDIAKSYIEDINDSFNPTLAKEYMDKALAECGLDSIELSIVISSDNAEMSIAATFLQEQWNSIFGGKVKLVINEMPSAQRLSTMKAWRENVNAYDLGLSNWSRSVTDTSPFNQMDVFSSSYYQKCNSSYHCETLETLIWKQKTDPAVKTDIEYNAQLAAEMEKAALEERIVIPLFERSNQYLVSEDVLIPEVQGEDPTYWVRWQWDIAE